ncbi:hypothetical protein Tco_0278498 [Tanacetum coccineum]
MSQPPHPNDIWFASNPGMPQNPNSASSSNHATPSSQHSISSSQYPPFVASLSDAQDKKFQRWTSEEEELLAKCYIAVSEDPNIERDQKLDWFWGKVLSTYNDSAPFQRNKDMLAWKWSTLILNCQKFNALRKRAQCLCKSCENEMDVFRHAKTMFKDEHKGRSFTQESSWDILRTSPKWDAAEPVTIPTVNVECTLGGNAEVFGQDKRLRPSGARRQKRIDLARARAGTAWSQRGCFRFKNE